MSFVLGVGWDEWIVGRKKERKERRLQDADGGQEVTGGCELVREEGQSKGADGSGEGWAIVVPSKERGFESVEV